MNQTTVIEDKSPLWRWFALRADSPHALAWLSLVSFLEPIILPFWPESLLSAMVLAHERQWKKFAAAASVSSVMGGIVGYGIGLLLFYSFGAPLLSYFGLHHLFQVVQMALVGNIFLVMLLTTFTPIPDKIFVLLGGFFHVPFFLFLAGFFIGRSGRFVLVAYLVRRFGYHIVAVVHRYFEILVAVLLAAFVFAVVRLIQLGLL